MIIGNAIDFSGYCENQINKHAAQGLTHAFIAKHNGDAQQIGADFSFDENSKTLLIKGKAFLLRKGGEKTNESDSINGNAETNIENR